MNKYHNKIEIFKNDLFLFSITISIIIVIYY